MLFHESQNMTTRGISMAWLDATRTLGCVDFRVQRLNTLQPVPSIWPVCTIHHP
jgi:hypothetical protein